MTHGSGAVITDLDDHDYLDLTSAFGAVLVGHAEPAVVEAVTAAAASGNLFYTSASPRRLELAQALLHWFPWGSRVLCFKTGSCAVTAAVRLAQHATGRQGVLTYGYHGWHDWHLEAVPEYRLFPSYATGLDGGPEELREVLRRRADQIGAVVVTPLPHRYPPEHYQDLNRIAHEHGCAFVLDEVKTGIRAGAGGYTARAGLNPDAVTVSKGLGNGFPISAVVCRGEMALAHHRSHVWNTYQHEQTALAAALTTLDLTQRWDVPGTVAAAGEWVVDQLRGLFTEHGIPLELVGWGPSFELDETDDSGVRERLQQTLLRHGVFCDVEDDFNISYRLAEQTEVLMERFTAAVRKL
ncbi:aminotransferase class III-fold pyridoxal phosphate-dependent enzyme [Streptomyces capitiformicae]|nr:aminotransferase class III-fold pyridoxal phosphate-dependent enzyme [Streptomyces capitiformicae]